MQPLEDAVQIRVGTGAGCASVPSPRGEESYVAAVEQIFGVGAEAVLALYPAASYPIPRKALSAIFGDLAQHCPTRRTLRALGASQVEPVRRYLFAYDFPSGPLAPFGAGHGMDMVFFWEDFAFLQHTPSAAETELAGRMMDYLIAFAATGNPEHGGAPGWPLYDPATDPYLKLDEVIEEASGFRGPECDFWDAVDAATR